MGEGKTADPIALRFARKVATKFRLEKAILFGSRARGDWLKRSDYDIILVSPDFEGKHFTERASEVRSAVPFSRGLDLLCYTPHEFAEKRKQIGIVRKAVKEGAALGP